MVKWSRFSPTNKTLDKRYRHHATRDSYWDGKRHKIFISLLVPFLIIQTLFIGLQAYIYGVAFHSTSSAHNLRTIAVDYDGGIVGQSMQEAYHLLEGPGFIGLEWHDASEYPTPDSIYDRVFQGGNIWAGVYVFSGASDRLAAALADNTTAQSYNNSGAIGAVYNQARYPDFADAYVMADLEELVITSRVVWNEINGTKALTSIPHDHTASLAVALNPIGSTVRNIKPLNDGVEVFYNTVGQVFTILMQFFFLMAFNTFLRDWQLDSKLPIKHYVIMRILISLVYTFVGSLLVALNIYAYRGNTTFSGAQVVLLWMAFWLGLHVIFLVMEIATTFLPQKLLPLFIITFIIANVSSAVLPFDLSPGFYRWGYALPSRNVYQLEITIMSGGANNSLDVNLPVLFAWEIILIPLAFFSTVWRLNKAVEADQEVQELIKADQERDVQTETEASRRRRLELSELARANLQDAARGTFGLGFPAPGPYNSYRKGLRKGEEVAEEEVEARLEARAGGESRGAKTDESASNE